MPHPFPATASGLPRIGLGCMNLSHAYGTPPTSDAAERLLLEAVDQGVTHFDTATLYGFGANETLVGRVLKPHRQRITLCSKGGLGGEPVGPGGSLVRVIDGRPETLRRHCEASLRRLQTDVIDLYYLHRWHKEVPIEDSVGELSRCVERGWVRSIGLSEVGATTLARAHCVHPIAALQTEYSLWTREPEIAVLQACRDLGVAFVAFSPLGRGFLTAAPPAPDGLVAGDIRRSMPRFAAAHSVANATLQSQLVRLAQAVGCSPAQLALAWVMQQGSHVCVIPGTTQPLHLRDNLGAAGVQLTPKVLAELQTLFHPRAAHGGRYSAASQAEVDTEQFAPSAA
jgi:aryl-alcohol dehydrogenase-like predicted oxidoreductase